MENLVVIQSVDFEKSVYEYTEEGIVIISIKDGAHIEIENSKEEFAHCLTMKDYLPMRILVRPGKGTTVSKEVREYVNLSESRSIVKCQAILVDNLAHKIIANFMMKLYKQPNMFKVFSDEEEAIKWLRAQA